MKSTKVKNLANKLLRSKNKKITIPNMLEIAIKEKLTVGDTKSVIEMLNFFGLDCVTNTKDWSPFKIMKLDEPHFDGVFSYISPLTRIYSTLMPTMDTGIWKRSYRIRELDSSGSTQKLECLGKWGYGINVLKDSLMHELITITNIE